MLVNAAPEIVGAGAEAEPLIAIEASRLGIVNRIMAEQAEELAARGLNGDALRYALMTLRADQLLAAALVEDFDEVRRDCGAAGGEWSGAAALRADDAGRRGRGGQPARRGGVSGAGWATRCGWRARRAVGSAAAGAQVVGYFVPATTIDQ